MEHANKLFSEEKIQEQFKLHAIAINASIADVEKTAQALHASFHLTNTETQKFSKLMQELSRA